MSNIIPEPTPALRHDRIHRHLLSAIEKLPPEELAEWAELHGDRWRDGFTIHQIGRWTDEHLRAVQDGLRTWMMTMETGDHDLRRSYMLSSIDSFSRIANVQTMLLHRKRAGLRTEGVFPQQNGWPWVCQGWFYDYYRCLLGPVEQPGFAQRRHEHFTEILLQSVSDVRDFESAIREAISKSGLLFGSCQFGLTGVENADFAVVTAFDENPWTTVVVPVDFDNDMFSVEAARALAGQVNQKIRDMAYC